MKSQTNPKLSSSDPLSRLAWEAVQRTAMGLQRPLSARTSLLFSLERGVLAVPLSSIVSVHACAQLSIASARGIFIGRYGGVSFPVVTIGELISNSNDSAPGVTEWDSLKRKSVILLEHQRRWAGLVVSEVLDRAEIVIQPFDSIVKAIAGFEGVSVLEDGRIVFVLSPSQVVSMASERNHD